MLGGYGRQGASVLNAEGLAGWIVGKSTVNLLPPKIEIGVPVHGLASDETRQIKRHRSPSSDRLGIPVTMPSCQSVGQLPRRAIFGPNAVAYRPAGAEDRFPASQPSGMRRQINPSMRQPSPDRAAGAPAQVRAAWLWPRLWFGCRSSCT